MQRCGDAKKNNKKNNRKAASNKSFEMLLNSVDCPWKRFISPGTANPLQCSSAAADSFSQQKCDQGFGKIEEFSLEFPEKIH